MVKALTFLTSTAAAVLFSFSVQATTLDDAAIMAIFDQANMADITTARLGLKKAQAPEVRALARMVLTDHEAVQQMGRDLAKKQGIVALPPDGDTSLTAQAEAYARLQAKSGGEFDRAYLAHEVAFHQGVIDAIKESLLPAIADPEFKALVTKVLPGFEHHLAETKKVAAHLGMN
ncbi:DUF4142 domain-containing protein [Novispirillum sp. DQ9]|uniref:DUF4142 domain-containing protein n=1 Tax=Novispirillum sp. DQ9 TaxID=3398612 RepID=UPI003C7E310A